MAYYGGQYQDFYQYGGGASGGSYGGGYGGGGDGYSKTKTSAPASEPFPMANFFLSDKQHQIHRDVMRMRIRSLLGGTAITWYEPDHNGNDGNWYRAETSLTKAQIEDLQRESREYRRNPTGFQRRLDRQVWDHSQWTEPGEPGSQYQQPGYDNPYPSQPYPSQPQSQYPYNQQQPQYPHAQPGSYQQDPDGPDANYGPSKPPAAGVQQQYSGQQQYGTPQQPGYSSGSGQARGGYEGTTAEYGQQYSTADASGAYQQQPTANACAQADQFLEGVGAGKGQYAASYQNQQMR